MRLVKTLSFGQIFADFFFKPAKIEKELGLQLTISSVFFPDPPRVFFRNVQMLFLKSTLAKS